MTDKETLSKKIKVKIKSVITLLDDGGNNGDNSDETVEFSSDGTLSLKGNTVEITYKESEALGVEGVESTLRFKQNRPTLINLTRKGGASASMLFDTELPKRGCTYHLGNLPLSFFIYTNCIKNDFSASKGKIALDYDIEINGVKTEHTLFTLEFED